MDDQLPKLEDFRAIEAEPELPEPWWKRYYSYIFFIALCTGLFAGEELLRNTGVIGKKPYHLHSPTYTIAESNEIVYRQTKIGAVFGFAVSIIACFSMEKYRKK